jgi:gamma-glutamylcyclotransferase (GGCT)/AIG2-like uncharacterized protein YtfP
MLRTIFVYGTLQRGQRREPCWPCAPQCVTPGFVAGRLYDLGPYPALVEGDGVVSGELWELPPEAMPETLAVLDEIEGYGGPAGENLYWRVTTAVHTDASLSDPQPRRAYVYKMRPSRLPATARLVESPARWSGRERRG